MLKLAAVLGAAVALALSACSPVSAVASPAPPIAAPGAVQSDDAHAPSHTVTRNSHLINLDTVKLIICPSDDGSMDMGSGTIIGHNRVLTANHVIADASAAGCEIDGKPAHVIWSDAALDAAVLSVGLGDTPVMPISCDGFAAGFPYLSVGYSEGEDFSLEVGIYTGEHIDMAANDEYNHDVPHLSAFDMQVFQGMSGGPIVDFHGRVTGIVNAGARDAPESLFRDLRDTPLCAALADHTNDTPITTAPAGADKDTDKTFHKAILRLGPGAKLAL